MNLFKIDLLFCIVLLIIVEVWPPREGLSQPVARPQLEILDTQESKRVIILDTTKTVKRGEDLIQQSIQEAKKGKSLSKSIQKESRRKPKQAKKILQKNEADIEGRVLYKEPDFKDSILTVSDSTFVELNKSSIKDSAKSKAKEPFFIRWFRKKK